MFCHNSVMVHVPEKQFLYPLTDFRTVSVLNWFSSVLENKPSVKPPEGYVQVVKSRYIHNLKCCLLVTGNLLMI